MSDYDHLSRVNKYDKRRKNTKSLSIFIVLGSVLLIALVLLLILAVTIRRTKRTLKMVVRLHRQKMKRNKIMIMRIIRRHPMIIPIRKAAAWTSDE